MPFLYNKQFMVRNLTKDWVLNDSEERNKLAQIKIGIAA